MRVALYCRVSTEEQAQQGFSIDHQKERLAAYCVSQGWDDYEFYIDDGYTGTSMNRPQLTRLIRHVKNRHVDTVIVYKLDRLSRKQKDVLYLLEDIFDANSAAFKSATEPFDTSTSLGKAMIGILAVFAQLERDTIVERARTGKRQRTRQGLWYGGPVPYGYEWSTEQQRLVVVPSQASLVQGLFERVLRGQSYNAIARWAEQRSKDRFFSHHKTLLYMLTNPVYIGKLNQDGDLVEGLHDGIVDADTWYQVQQEMKRRKNGRAPYGKYLLSNLLQCGVCGAPMKHMRAKDYRSSPPSPRNYYICRTKHTNRACSSRYYQQDKLEQQVISELKQQSVNLEFVKHELAARRDDEHSSDNVIDELTAQLEDINEKLERWYTAFENGSMDPTHVAERVRALEEQKKALFVRLDEIEDVDHDESDNRILDSLQQIGQQWDHMTEDERTIVLRAAVKKITVNADGTLTFTWDE